MSQQLPLSSQLGRDGQYSLASLTPIIVAIMINARIRTKVSLGYDD